MRLRALLSCSSLGGNNRCSGRPIFLLLVLRSQHRWSGQAPKQYHSRLTARSLRCRTRRWWLTNARRDILCTRDSTSALRNQPALRDLPCTRDSTSALRLQPALRDLPGTRNCTAASHLDRGARDSLRRIELIHPRGIATARRRPREEGLWRRSDVGCCLCASGRHLARGHAHLSSHHAQERKQSRHQNHDYARGND
jgi:hypothetical protein